MKGKRYYCVVPCVLKVEATSYAARLESEGASPARLDMEVVRSCSCAPDNWEGIISQKDDAITSLRKRVRDLEAELKEKDESIHNFSRDKEACKRWTRNANETEEELLVQESLFFSGKCMDFISRVGGVSRLTMFNSAWHRAHSGRKGSLNATKLFWG